jgi:hypothetical protein
MVEEMFGRIPKDTNDEAYKYLAKGKNILDPWLRWNAYLIQRKHASVDQKPDVLLGYLVFIKALMVIIGASPEPLKPLREDVVPEEKQEEDKGLLGVEAFTAKKK